MTLDALDEKILNILLRDATISKSEIAKRIGIAQSAVSERVRKLRESGIIERFETRISAKKLDFDTLAYVFISERKPTEGIDTASRLCAVTGVEEVHKIAGEDCFLLKIRARDTEELGRLLDEEVNPIETVAGTRTTIVLHTYKEDASLSGTMLFQDREAQNS